MSQGRQVTVLCNGPPFSNDGSTPKLVLDYRREAGAHRNITLDLPSFVRDVYKLPPRVLDLLEIAAYVYAADRHVSRGAKDAVEYHGWSRDFEFHIRVRDADFWSQPAVACAMSEALRFMSGDNSFQFVFYPGHQTPPTSLFDRADFVPPQAGCRVHLLPFSGGLDSLSGAVELLTQTDEQVCLVSHQAQSAIMKTQNALAAALSREFRGRVSHYKFECSLSGTRAREETQRTRSFLYCAITYAIAASYDQDEFYVFENGVTSMNFARREDLVNARASRTTHPQSLYRLQKLLSHIAERSIAVRTPFLWKTKAEVIAPLKESPMAYLIPSAVSCTRTFKIQGTAPQCGECFQCLDRRIAMHSIDADSVDHGGLYATDVIIRPFSDPENRTTALDYVRQASYFVQWHEGRFYDERLNDLAQTVDFILEPGSEAEKVGRIWDLYRRHGHAVAAGIQRMKSLHDDPFKALRAGSLLQLLASREHLKPEVCRLADSIEEILVRGIPRMFSQGRRPADENDLNAKVAGLLGTHVEKLRSEHPTASFACAKVVPDHIILKSDLVLESKYVRNRTSPSKVSDGIASDITKYPRDALKFFVVYDPDAAVPDPAAFREDIESNSLTRVLILR